MRNALSYLALLALSTALCTTGYAVAQMSMSIQTGKPENPVVGLPFTADESVRTVQHLANGMSLNHQMKGHLYRSADGVDRIETTVDSTDPAKPGSTTMVYIVDRAKHTATLLNSTLKTATVTRLPPNATVAVSFLAQPRTPGAASTQALKPEDITTTDLGKRTQEMMPLVGRRVTGTIPAGKVGNDQPILITTDVWFAPQLKLIVNQVEQNPLVGERIVELTNIRSVEPDPKLFEIPDGYTVKQQASMLGAAPLAMGDSDALVKNNAAYALANDNDHLSEAQTLAEQALSFQEQKTLQIISAGEADKSFDQVTILTSYWDTLGWVFYRLGKLDKAEPYIRAAWELKPNLEYGVHLGSIYEAQLRPKDAIVIYRMSLNGKGGPLKDTVQAGLARLGDPNAEPLPMQVAIPLPLLGPRLLGDTPEPLVDILIAGDKQPVVTLLRGDPTLEKSLTPAIQSALAKFLPDSGPEKILIRASVRCLAGETPACALSILPRDQAKKASHSEVSP